MSDLTKQPVFLPRTRAMETTSRSLSLTAIVAGLLLTTMSFLTGCGGGETGNGPPVTLASGSAGATTSLEWHPVQDPSIMGYFIHYGRQSPHHSGSCAYEHSKYVESPSVTLTNLDPETHYYFAVSAYNGLESACSNEVSTVTPAPSA